MRCGELIEALVAVGLIAWLSGCTQSERFATKPQPRVGLVDQSTALQSRQPSLGKEVRNQKLAMAIVRGEARGGYLVEGVDAGEIARLHLTNAFQSSPNYVVANRSVLKEAAAERQLQSTNSSESFASGTLTSADYIVRVTVTQIERQIRADGSSMEWRFLVGGSTKDRQRQGAVEVMVEVVDVQTTNTVYTARGIGLLDEIEQEQDSRAIFVRSEKGNFRRVTVSDAVRAACFQAAEEIDRYFASR